MKKEDCIFCKIAGGEIPSNTIYENSEFKVIMDIAPASKGHVLIIPKEHFKDIYEIDAITIIPVSNSCCESIKRSASL